MIDNIIKAKELLEDARCLSILHECDRGWLALRKRICIMLSGMR